MSNFENIIKNKVEQFDVPYNEVHWNKLDNKLTSLKKARVRKNVLISGVSILVVALVALVLLPKETIQKNNTKVIVENDNPPTNTATNKSEVATTETNVTNRSTELANENTIINNVGEESEKAVVVQEQKITNTNKLNETANNKTTPPVVIDKISAEFIVYNNKVCLGEEVSFEALDKKELLVYSWDFGDGNTSVKANPKHAYKQEGAFSVQLKVVNKKTGEEFASIQKNVATINPLPNADFTYLEKSTQFDDNKLKYPKTHFNYLGGEADKCSWVFGNGKKSNENNPAIIFDKKGEYTVLLLSKNKFGCSASISKTIEILTPFELFAPSAFTPNFDGNNDEFLPEAFITWDIKFEMIIKNKQGNVVFKTTDKNNAWKGSLNNQGAILEQELYFWQVITYDAENNPHQHIGRINLIK